MNRNVESEGGPLREKVLVLRYVSFIHLKKETTINYRNFLAVLFNSHRTPQPVDNPTIKVIPKSVTRVILTNLIKTKAL